MLTFLAVLLLLAATRAERSQLAIRLRTMGLPHGRERLLARAEVLPLLAVGVVAGTLVGVLAPSALAPALDLAPFTGAVTRPARSDPRPLTGLVVGAGGARPSAPRPPDRRRVRPTRQPRRPPAQRRHRMTTSPARSRTAVPHRAHDGPDIHCDNLVRIFSSEGVEVVALQGLDLEVGRGELVAVVGASGSGKSTLLNILSGLDLPSAGVARVAGRDLLTMSTKDRLHYRRHTVGFLFQQATANLLPYLSAVENVQLPMMFASLSSGERAERARGDPRRARHPGVRRPPPRRAVGRPAAARRPGRGAGQPPAGPARRRAHG